VCASARSTSARCRPARSARVASISSRSQSRTSVATCVVARAAGVQALAGVAGKLDEAGLDVEVDVFQVEAPFEAAGLDLGRDRRQAALDRRQVGGADDTLRRQHGRHGPGCRRCRRARGADRRPRSPCSASRARWSAPRRGPPGLGFCSTGCSWLAGVSVKRAHVTHRRRHRRNRSARRASGWRQSRHALAPSCRNSIGAPSPHERRAQARIALDRLRHHRLRFRGGVRAAAASAPTRLSTSATSASCCGRCSSCTVSWPSAWSSRSAPSPSGSASSPPARAWRCRACSPGCSPCAR